MSYEEDTCICAPLHKVRDYEEEDACHMRRRIHVWWSARRCTKYGTYMYVYVCIYVCIGYMGNIYIKNKYIYIYMR
jgi:hypothetical protein